MRRIQAHIGLPAASLKAATSGADADGMATSQERAGSLAGAVALALASGALYAASFPPTPAGMGRALAWIALAPLFLALRERGPGASALLAGLWAAVATGGVVRWLVPTLHDHFGWSIAASAGFLAGLAAVSAAPYCATVFALARLGARRRLSPAAFAAAFVASELLRAQLGLRSPWAPLGASQVDADRIRQLADLAGVYGVSGLVALTSAALASGLADTRLGRPRARAWRPALGAGVALLATLVYGELRLREAEDRRGRSDAPALDVALVQGNLTNEQRWRRGEASRVLRRYGGLTRDVLRGGGDLAAQTPPDLVIWPENAIQTAVDDPQYGRPLLALARSAPLLLGAPRPDAAGDGGSFNSAHLITRDAHVSSYDKRRLLPFGESKPLGSWLAFGPRGDLDGGRWVAGSRSGVLAFEGRALGVLLCLESLHPELARELVAEGADLLVNLSNDSWFAAEGGREQHFAQTVFRAVETRRPLLRATPTGITAVVSPTGEVEARLPAGERGVLRARVEAPTRAAPLYARVGDVFALGCLLACSVPALRLGLGTLRSRVAHSASRATGISWRHTA